MRLILWVAALIFLVLGIYGGFVQAAKMGDAQMGIEYSTTVSAEVYSDAERLIYSVKRDMYALFSVTSFLGGTFSFLVLAWMAETYNAARKIRSSIDQELSE